MNRRTAVRLHITGRVQGVGYRYWVVGLATKLGLDGWVRNRRDGGVEAVFAGPVEAVADMVGRCHRGPTLARVDGVSEDPETASVEPGFRALPTA